MGCVYSISTLMNMSGFESSLVVSLYKGADNFIALNLSASEIQSEYELLCGE